MEGEEWQDRLRSWVPAGCDAWIVQREVQDVTQYAELWLRDSGDHRSDPEAYAERYEAWLDEFEARGTTSVGFGWITLRRSAAAAAGNPSIVVEEWPHAVLQPLGRAVEDHFARQDYLRDQDDAALLAGHFTLAAEVVQEQVGLPGAEDPEHVVLRQHRGMMRATKVDAVAAGFAGVCDGSLPAGRILDAIAQLMSEDPVLLRDRTPQAIRLLVEEGFLEPVPGAGQVRGEAGVSRTGRSVTREPALEGAHIGECGGDCGGPRRTQVRHSGSRPPRPRSPDSAPDRPGAVPPSRHPSHQRLHAHRCLPPARPADSVRALPGLGAVFLAAVTGSSASGSAQGRPGCDSGACSSPPAWPDPYCSCSCAPGP